MYTESLRLPVGPGALHVERSGRGGPSLLLVHGFGTSAFQWRAVAPALAARGVAVMAPDLLGFGASDRPGGADFGPEAQAGYLEQALTALRLGALSVVGEGLGALVALLLAARFPARVRQVGVLSPLDPADLPGPALRALQRLSPGEALGANGLFGARPLLEELLAPALPAPRPEPDRLLARYVAPFVGREGVADLLRLAGSVALTAQGARDLSSLSGAVHLWTADGTDSEAAAASWRERLAGARFSSSPLPVAPGQLAAESAPEALASAIAAWLA